MSKILIIKHWDPNFTGFSGGVDFHRGRGSTSSMSDAANLLELGSVIEGDESQAIVRDYLWTHRLHTFWGKTISDLKLF